MSKIIYHADFKTLRKAYLIVKNFVENESATNICSLHTKIQADLGLSGDDNLELLNKFISTFKLNAKGFDYSKYFQSEGELYGSSAAFINIMLIPLLFISRLIKLLSFEKIDFTKGKFYSFGQRETLDLSFGDLLTWYLTGSFNPRNQVKVVI